jgi:hypothetical protein
MSHARTPAYMLHTQEHGLIAITEAQAEKLKQAGGYEFADTVMGSSVDGVVFITKKP